MRRFAWARWLPPLMLVAAAGCAETSMALRGDLDQLRQQQMALSRQNQELQSRTSALDRDNQELEKLLAQSRQQTRVAEDQVAILRTQLGSVTSQLAQFREDKKTAEAKTEALSASIRRQGGVSISPNNSFLSTLPTINLTDVHARRDGDVLRIELPGSRLFEFGSDQLHPGAMRLIADVAAEIIRTYPYQIIGVEGHTDSDPVQNSRWQSNKHLSIARATAVHDALITYSRLQPEQLFLVGHGANHPIVSNATEAGKRRNRRVELVVYPDRVQ